jgi:hypothetical protein
MIDLMSHDHVRSNVRRAARAFVATPRTSAEMTSAAAPSYSRPSSWVSSSSHVTEQGRRR